jgi:hypothetical protein
MAEVITNVPPGAQQQPDHAPAPLDQWAHQSPGEVRGVGGLVQGIDHRRQGTAGLAQPGQQPGHAAADRGGVGVQVVDAGSRGQAGQDLPGGQVPGVDGNADRVLARDGAYGQAVAGDGGTAAGVGERGENPQDRRLARARVASHDHGPGISRVAEPPG